MKKRDRALQTKQELLNVAEKLFAESGYESTSVSSICHTAGVSKGAFYHHFSSKQTLFLELMQRWLGSLEKQLTELEGREVEVPEKLLSMAHVVGEVLELGGPQLSIYLEFWNQALRDRDVYSALSKPFDDFLEFFSGLLDRGMERGVIKDTNSEMAARIVISIGIGLLFQGLLDPGGTDWNAVTEYGLKVLLEGLNSEQTL